MRDRVKEEEYGEGGGERRREGEYGKGGKEGGGESESMVSE